MVKPTKNKPAKRPNPSTSQKSNSTSRPNKKLRPNGNSSLKQKPAKPQQQQQQKEKAKSNGKSLTGKKSTSKAEDDKQDSKEEPGSDESEGVDIEELSSDDFLFGSGESDADDDDLSVMDDSDLSSDDQDNESLDESVDDQDISMDDDEDKEEEEEEEEEDDDDDISNSGDDELSDVDLSGSEGENQVEQEQQDSDKESQAEDEIEDDDSDGFDLNEAYDNEDDEELVDSSDDQNAQQDTDDDKSEQDIEDLYEQKRLKREKHLLREKQAQENQRLPIRLPTGQIMKLEAEQREKNRDKSSRSIFKADNDDDQDFQPDDQEYGKQKYKESSPGLAQAGQFGERYGRPAIRSILSIKNTKQRIHAARQEIAELGREIIADPEANMNNLKRLLALCHTKFSEGPGSGKNSSKRKDKGKSTKFNYSNSKSETEPFSAEIDIPIRIMAILSLLAVFLDIIPGYRIRPIAEKEQQIRVSQMVQKQRDFEQGLVALYRKYLEICEEGFKQTQYNFGNICTRCLCQLLKEKTHFNFSSNIMEVIVKKLTSFNPDKPPNDSFNECLTGVIAVFEKDTDGESSLNIVRYIVKAVRTKSGRINPEIMSALLHLRLGDDLDNVRASADKVDKNANANTNDNNKNKNNKQAGKKKHGHIAAQQNSFVNKKARKAMKDREAVEKELEDAEAGVKSDKRKANRTETLKLVFALYFRIIKMPKRSPLLSGVLEGLARYANLINVDFFADLLAILKDLSASGSVFEDLDAAEEEQDDNHGPTRLVNVRERLLCIVTAFELLSGQGQALNIDLGGFITQMYTMLPVLALSPRIEEKPGENEFEKNKARWSISSEADLLFQVLHHIFLSSRTPSPTVRSLAFCKRLLTSSLQWPSKTALRTIDFTKRVLIKDPKLEHCLNNADEEEGSKGGDGVYNPFTNVETLANAESTIWWELLALENQHPDLKVRNEATKLLQWQRNT